VNEREKKFKKNEHTLLTIFCRREYLETESMVEEEEEEEEEESETKENFYQHHKDENTGMKNNTPTNKMSFSRCKR
jgi:hypothetical protein